MRTPRITGLVVAVAMATIPILGPTLARGACILTCPASIIVSTDPNQCGAVVTFPNPIPIGICGAILASPASGSFFPEGLVGTTVTATSTAGPSCTFTVTVLDGQAPTITCPADMTAVTSSATTRVGFNPPVATDNCPGVTVAATAPTSAPLGTTTILGTATDARGNTATCSFLATIRLAFDFDGDGKADIVTAAGPGGGPHVRVLSGADGHEILSFFAYDAAFAGGVRSAVCDLNGDGVPDIVTAPGPGGGPHIRAFDGDTGAQLPGAIGSFFAYEPSFTGGVFVACDDVNGDGVPDILTGAGPGGGPHVRAFSGVDAHELLGTFAFSPAFTGGVFVAP